MSSGSSSCVVSFVGKEWLGGDLADAQFVDRVGAQVSEGQVDGGTIGEDFRG